LVNGVESCVAAGKPLKIGLEIREKDHDKVAILIKDIGPGIPKKELRNLFVPFYTTKQTGSGLGLYVSRKLMEEMGGRLELHSRAGEEGVIATVELPRHTK
jgi:two-component system, sporulation sensor kinase D